MHDPKSSVRVRLRVNRHKPWPNVWEQTKKCPFSVRFRSIPGPSLGRKAAKQTRVDGRYTSPCPPLARPSMTRPFFFLPFPRSSLGPSPSPSSCSSSTLLCPLVERPLFFLPRRCSAFRPQLSTLLPAKGLDVPFSAASPPRPQGVRRFARKLSWIAGMSTSFTTSFVHWMIRLQTMRTWWWQHLSSMTTSVGCGLSSGDQSLAMLRP